jgi:hypothetical protein
MGSWFFISGPGARSAYETLHRGSQEIHPWLDFLVLRGHFNKLRLGFFKWNSGSVQQFVRSAHLLDLFS